MKRTNNAQNINRYMIAGLTVLLAIVVLLLGEFLFAREYAQIINIVVLVLAVSLVLAVIVLLKVVILPMETKNSNNLDENFLSDFTTSDFVKLHGDMVKDNSKNYAFISFCLPNFKQINKNNDDLINNRNLAKVCQIIQSLEKPQDKFVRHSETNFEGIFCYETQTDIFDFIENLTEKAKGIEFAFGVSLIENSNKSLFTYEEKAQMALEKAIKGNKMYEITKDIIEDGLREYIINNMNKALKENEFVMYLQPKYDLLSNSVCGADALVRWIKPDGSILFPQDIIGVFEETGFIIKVDIAILQQACIKIVEWINKGYTPIPISIKISKLHILNSAFIQSLYQMIKKYKIPTHLIEFDISETSISVTVDKLIDLNHEFEGKEALVSFEDSQKGTSAIKVLQELPANTIRCNSDLLNVAQNNPKIYDIINKMIDAFNKKNVKVLTENIETKLQLDLAKRLNCRYVMGFLFSKPLSKDQFDKVTFDKQLLEVADKK